MSNRKLADLPLRGLTQADGRLRAVQSYRRLRRQLIADMGEDIPATRLAVIETLAQAAAIQREEFAAIIADPSRDPSRFTGLGNLVIGSARTLGLKRIPKDVPSLHEYLAARATESVQAASTATSDAQAATTHSDAQGGSCEG